MTREQCMKLKPGDKVYVTKGCPDSNPRQAQVTSVAWGGSGAFCGLKGAIVPAFLHLTAAEALAHFEKLRAAAIEEVEKQIRTAPNRLNKLRHRKPVIEE